MESNLGFPSSVIGTRPLDSRGAPRIPPLDSRGALGNSLSRGDSRGTLGIGIRGGIPGEPLESGRVPGAPLEVWIHSFSASCQRVVVPCPHVSFPKGRKRHLQRSHSVTAQVFTRSHSAFTTARGKGQAVWTHKASVLSLESGDHSHLKKASRFHDIHAR